MRLRSGDFLARLDRARFAVVLEGDADSAQLEGIAQGLRDVLQRVEIELDRGVVLGLEARVGIARYPREGDDSETLLENASVAWEVADCQGGVRFYSHGSEFW
jgi:GGDEF domain-containing protein